MTPFVQRLIALWTTPLDTRDDAAADFAECYADPVTVNGVSLTVADLVARARAVQRAYTDLRSEMVHELAADRRLVIAFHLRGRHVGPLKTPLGTVTATGRAVDNRVTDILTVVDGKITDIWVISDDLDTLRQLDAVELVAKA